MMTKLEEIQEEIDRVNRQLEILYEQRERINDRIAAIELQWENLAKIKADTPSDIVELWNDSQFCSIVSTKGIL